MSKRTIPILLALAVLLAACGPKATPTMNPADVQGTAVAAAWTMVAETQAAIPSATPMPPTDTPSPTPLPTFTQAVSLPTLPTVAAFFPTATPLNTSGNANSCLVPLSVGEAGPTVRVRIENETGGTIYSISLNLYEKNDFGQCGAITVTNIAKNAKEIVDLPKGKWYAYAWINYKGGTSGTSSGSFELRVGDDLIRLVVQPEVITAKGP